MKSKVSSLTSKVLTALVLVGLWTSDFRLQTFGAARLRSPKDAGLIADAPMLRTPHSALRTLAPIRTIRLLWDNAPGAFITDIWGTTNFITWYAAGSVTNTNTITLPRLLPAEFYRASHPNRPGHRWTGYEYTAD